MANQRLGIETHQNNNKTMNFSCLRKRAESQVARWAMTSRGCTVGNAPTAWWCEDRVMCANGLYFWVHCSSGGKWRKAPKYYERFTDWKVSHWWRYRRWRGCHRLDAAPFAGTTIPRIVVICVNCGYQSEMFISGAVGLDERRPLAFTFKKMNKMVRFKLFLRLFCCRLTNSMKSNQMIM